MEQTAYSGWDTEMSLSLRQDVRCSLPHLMSPEKCQMPGLLQGLRLLQTWSDLSEEHSEALNDR